MIICIWISIWIALVILLDIVYQIKLWLIQREYDRGVLVRSFVVAGSPIAEPDEGRGRRCERSERANLLLEHFTTKGG